MTVIRPNSISGITSITAQANEINFFRSDGTLAGLQINGINFNNTSGISTLAALNVTGNVSIAGTLTYEDVTNVDSIGIITARSTIDAQGDISIVDKIIHTGDTNTSIRFPAADTFAVETGGSERLRIASDGNLTISGNSSVKDITYGDGSTTGYFRSITNVNRANADASIHMQQFKWNNTKVAEIKVLTGDDTTNKDNAHIVFETASAGTTAERLRITSGGDLRFGLNSVAEQTDSAHYIMTLTGKSGQTGAGAIAFKDPSANTDGFIFADGGNLFITADYSNATADSSIRFRVDGSSEKLRITSDGKIGINDTAPERTMDVRGSNCMIQLEGTGGSGKQWSLCSADNTTGAAVGTAGMFAIYNDTDGVAALRVSNSNYVLRPKLPYFYATATPTVGSNYIHSFGNVHGNNGNHYNNSNGRFTAPVTGFYWFACGIWCNSSSNTTGVLIQLQRYVQSSNASTSFAGANHRTQYNSLNCSGGTYMESGDYVWIQQTGVSIQASTPRNYFSGYLVG